MSGEAFAAPDYEPTADEIRTFIDEAFAEPPAPGEHGNITIIPAFERLLWEFPVYWGRRQVNPDGSISFAWCVPQPCPHAGPE